MTKDPILFVSHDAGPTGAPVLLLHLLRWLRANTKVDFRVALKKTGSLEGEFAALAPTAVFARAPVSIAARIAERLAPYRARPVLEDLKFRQELGSNRFALIYSNTIVNGNVLRRLPDRHCPLISHVHELNYMIERFTGAEDLTYTLARTARFIAGSGAVARNLVDGHAVESTKIDVVYEFIPSLEFDRPRLAESARRLRTQLQIPDRAPIVGAAGTVDWRKGYDAFILLAVATCRSGGNEDAHFVWVGANDDRHIPAQITYDLHKLGLEGRVHFVGHRRNYLDYLAMFDIFCLTSREDPFPLVVLEAAALGTPVVCFEKSGGSPEFVESDCGFVVPYLDISAMAARVMELIGSSELRSRLGRRGQTKVREHHDVTVIAPRIAEIIERTIMTSDIR